MTTTSPDINKQQAQVFIKLRRQQAQVLIKLRQQQVQVFN